MGGLIVINFIFALYCRLTVRSKYSRIPFFRGGCWLNVDGPAVIALTEEEAKRCVEAIDWYIESHAPEMENRGLDAEIGRYEDLMYRCMGVPDKNIKFHVADRE